MGSIPAHAGEPASSPDGGRGAGVYPRPRGGTSLGIRRHLANRGLSPPTRGNRPTRRPVTATPRSIPAHAGEPPASSHSGLSDAVYPRPRGGTGRTLTSSPARRGLSPPTRGNLVMSWRKMGELGSIPAHAGEPHDNRARHASDEVYPRPRGLLPYTFFAALNPVGKFSAYGIRRRSDNRF